MTLFVVLYFIGPDYMSLICAYRYSSCIFVHAALTMLQHLH